MIPCVNSIQCHSYVPVDSIQCHSYVPVDTCTFMIPPKQKQLVWVFHLVCEKKTYGLQRSFTPKEKIVDYLPSINFLHHLFESGKNPGLP